MYRKILFAHDGSERRGALALPHLATLARSGAEVVLCHVVSPPDSFDMPDTVDQTTPSTSVVSNERLDRLQGDLWREGIERVETLILDGHPAASIAAAARDLECDLVVMVTRARGGVSRFFAGSVADDVIHHTANAGVLLLRDEGE